MQERKRAGPLRTAGDLKVFLGERLGERRLIVVSNREPYITTRTARGMRWERPAGGLVAALDPVLRANGGTWVAHGSGSADRDVVDATDGVMVPPRPPRAGGGQFRLRRVWISEADERAYYDGFANQALWPLCHQVFVRPRFESAEWLVYRKVNQAFARAILQEVGDEPAIIFVQDYHLALVPRLLKAARPDLTVGLFWHIPWPTREMFRICPWADEILDGLLGADVLGFHIQEYCTNFLTSVDRSLEATVDVEEGDVLRKGRRTRVRPFPIGVDVGELTEMASSRTIADRARSLRRELGLQGSKIGVGVDRLDYTKGIPERIAAVDRMLERHPEYSGKFTFLQLGPLSRSRIDAYQALSTEIVEMVAAVNQKHGRDGWEPIRLLTENHPRERLLAYFRMADVCIVSALHDGMNLVAKEFVAARTDRGGSLVLSEFAGAVEELDGALTVNPFDADRFADVIRDALTLPADERRRRMTRMRTAIERNTIYDWAGAIVAELGRIDRIRQARRRATAIGA